MRAPKIRRSGSGQQTSRGFTLLEVMLAFVVFAISFSTVLEIMAGSMRSIKRTNEDTEVALLAQSVMDLVGTEIVIQEGEFSGVGMDKYEWQLGIYLYASGGEDNNAVELAELAELSGIELYWIDLNVGWESGRHQRDMHFSTIRSVLAGRR